MANEGAVFGWEWDDDCAIHQLPVASPHMLS